uniref:photosystem I assembly protein Ycf4 n=1 Tax=Machaerium brasiliense TaxID=450031 RepID=UPI002205CD84|nr:photosystem I assembly protein Ycf4 [Machaerium brasiliense]UXL84139.1 photosystem I assembly protein Ycf4 [Machaerium brasiliense]
MNDIDYNANYRSEDLLVHHIAGSRTTSNFGWAFLLFLGSLGFLLVGTSSYLDRDLLYLFPSQQILFFPQGIVMSFYGIAGLLISSYLWCTIWWDVGSGYNIFDKKERKVCIFRWGFPGKNRRIYRRFRMDDIHSLIIGNQSPIMENRHIVDIRSILYMEVLGQGFIPLTPIDEKLPAQLIVDKAGELAGFLRVPIEIWD